MPSQREIDFLVKHFTGRFTCFQPGGELSLQCGYVRQNHRKAMKAEHGKLIPWQLNINSTCEKSLRVKI